MACQMCHRESDTDECEECQRYREYYESLTPDQRRKEEQMIADYAREAEERGF